MVFGFGDEYGNILDRQVIPTEDPVSTLDAMVRYYKENRVDALGIGSFGPICLDRNSETYGYITSTPKPGWMNTDVVGTFKRELGIPVGFDTDVNGAVLGEVTYGAARGTKSAIYITIGTGVGVGVYYEGKLMHGLVHPEAGHILLMRYPGDTYKGRCPYHKNCMEGLASGPAIEERWGAKGDKLSEKAEVWEMESFYIAQAIADYILCYSPEKIILWGGVMHQNQMFSMVRSKVKEMLGGYVASEMFNTDLSDYIVAPGLGEDPGIKGALKLGLMELEK